MIHAAMANPLFRPAFHYYPRALAQGDLRLWPPDGGRPLGCNRRFEIIDASDLLDDVVTGTIPDAEREVGLRLHGAAPTGNGIFARSPIRPNSASKALGVIGPSRSDIKTCEDSPCSRCRRRSARISSPCIGWTLGEPFFALRTCSRPVASSTFDHCKSHNSDARKPWR
jgi:hypothetical protein